MAIEQEMGLYQQSPPWCLPVWWTALVSGLQLHKTRHQDQGEESPRGVGGGGGGSVNSYVLSTDCTGRLEDGVHVTIFMISYSRLLITTVAYAAEKYLFLLLW